MLQNELVSYLNTQQAVEQMGANQELAMGEARIFHYIPTLNDRIFVLIHHENFTTKTLSKRRLHQNEK